MTLTTPNEREDWESKKPTEVQRRYWDSLKGIKDEKAPNYKEIVGKSQVHKWLDVHYGKPRNCESNTCDGETESRWFDWALKTGMEYKRTRDNFYRLCRSCHRKYDLTEEKKEQALKNLWWKKGTPVPNLMGRNQYSPKLPEQARNLT